ncbi:tryptophan--tRNA ligase [Mesomycoplasma hyorhinis]|uniref:tryptophan--tRNA ligase n=1 Tax=Mesomycoplasma hyorhinis TaxID=2100 RepID=UPI001C0515D2|nr:tryptophan--tRNA ligase [Mesomycoplasma hyorhinis]
MKNRIVSGVTATGKLTLGNYLGSIKTMVKMQEEYESYIFVADLHALTVDIKPEELRENKEDIFAFYLACGINSEKSIIFYQSDVAEHSELAWIMQTHTSIGELSRMTQFKDKSKIKTDNGTETIPTGLLTYPTLMAADILLYNPDFVPVGIDQKQHIELTRNLALKLNNKYKTKFKEVEIMTPKIGGKIMSLTNPTKKMSKSTQQPNSAIFLLDDPELAYKKIQKAITDSENKIYLSDDKPGVKNLLTIFSSLKEWEMKKTLEFFKDKNYKDLKHEVGLIVKEFLIHIQSEYKKVKDNIEKYSQLGKERAKAVASEHLKFIKQKIGL